jgi:hypothetical protein
LSLQIVTENIRYDEFLLRTFDKAEDGLRATRSMADPYSLKVRHGRLDPRRNFFIIRLIEDWNRIPAKQK